MTSRVWTLPNIFTLARLALVPVFMVLYGRGHTSASLVCFAVAALTDGVDGFLARALHQQSKLGAFLDAVADKVLILAALVLLAVDRQVPWWLLGLILFRDGAMIVGTVVVRRKNLELPSQPSRVGKYATFALVLYVSLAMVQSSMWRLDVVRGYVPVIGFLSALCIVVSTIQYFARFGHLFFDPPRPV
jgi:cardiolipin synthase